MRKTKWHFPAILLTAIVLVTALLYGGCISRGIKPPPGVAPERVMLETTGYCKCGSCCGWRRNWWGRPVIAAGPNRGDPKAVGVTASGRRAGPGTIAADTSLYPFGTVLYVPGYGYGVVADRGSAIQGRHIDLYFRTHRQAKEWGRRQLAVKVWRGAR